MAPPLGIDSTSSSPPAAIGISSLLPATAGISSSPLVTIGMSSSPLATVGISGSAIDIFCLGRSSLNGGTTNVSRVHSVEFSSLKDSGLAVRWFIRFPGSLPSEILV